MDPYIVFTVVTLLRVIHQFQPLYFTVAILPKVLGYSLSVHTSDWSFGPEKCLFPLKCILLCPLLPNHTHTHKFQTPCDQVGRWYRTCSYIGHPLYRSKYAKQSLSTAAVQRVQNEVTAFYPEGLSYMYCNKVNPMLLVTYCTLLQNRTLLINIINYTIFTVTLSAKL